MVNRICLDQFAGFGDAWTPRVVRTDSFLPADGNASTLEDASDATQANNNLVLMGQVMPDHLGTAFEGGSQR